MIKQSKSRYKPFYKQFLRLRKNVQNRQKIFKFKRQKWNRLLGQLRTQLKFFRRFRIRERERLLARKFESRGNSIQRKFKNVLHQRKTLSLLYGRLKRKYLKRTVKKVLKGSLKGDFRNEVLKALENRLDVVLYRAKFSFSVENARQLIKDGHVYVNRRLIQTRSYVLNVGDCVEIAPVKKSKKLVQRNIDRSNFWPIPPKNLVVSYKTLQILVISNESPNFLSTPSQHVSIDFAIENTKRF